MRIVIVGQQAFGKAALDAFIARGDEVAGVFAAPDRTGARPDPLVAARPRSSKLPVYRFPNYSADEAKSALAELKADIGVMAYVLLFAPPEFCAIPKHGMIQFHPSLLPLHRGPSSIPWAIIRGPQRDRVVDLPADPGSRRRRRWSCKKGCRSAPTTPPARSISTRSSRSASQALVEAADLVVAGARYRDHPGRRRGDL